MAWLPCTLHTHQKKKNSNKTCRPTERERTEWQPRVSRVSICLYFAEKLCTWKVTERTASLPRLKILRVDCNTLTVFQHTRSSYTNWAGFSNRYIFSFSKFVCIRWLYSSLYLVVFLPMMSVSYTYFLWPVILLSVSFSVVSGKKNRSQW